ncbi:MAG: diguanylate cyclase [Nitrospirae bacterium YQR-1]
MAEKVRVMLVEDESIIALDIKSSLEIMGYAVTSISSEAGDAINRAKAELPDLILMDIMLGGKMEGITAARHIRQTYGIPVIFLSAYSSEEILARATSADAFGYMLKPFREEELRNAIEMALCKHKMEKSIYETKQLLYTTLVSIADGVVTTDARGIITFINPAAEELTGFSSSEVVGRFLPSLITFTDESTGQTIDNPVERAITEKMSVTFTNHILTTAVGRVVPVSESAAPIKDDMGQLIGVVLTFKDHSERKRLEAKLHRLTITDCLTDLHNRRGFYVLSEQYLKVSRRMQRDVYLVFIDVDGMKYINDTYGHLTGDTALMDAAGVLRETFRESDIIARLGGDEFVVLITDESSLSETSITERLNAAVEQFNKKHIRHYNLSLSVGVAKCTPESTCTMDELMAYADRLMYQQKQTKKPDKVYDKSLT